MRAATDGTLTPAEWAVLARLDRTGRDLLAVMGAPDPAAPVAGDTRHTWRDPDLAAFYDTLPASIRADFLALVTKRNPYEV